MKENPFIPARSRAQWVKPIFASLLGIMVFGVAPRALHAQDGTPASSGVYTTPQAARGADLYQSKCSTCHGPELAGDGTAPPLAGPVFVGHWGGQPVASLFDYIHTSMPSDQPGTLSDHEVADLIAFLLRSSKFPAGHTELPAVPDQLNAIVIDDASAAHGN